jgi:DNA modification methylase
MEQLSLFEKQRNDFTQRADYTFKYNKKLGRHGWLRLTPAYSVKLVQELLKEQKRNSVVFDPFSGTATTTLVAGEKGLKAISKDINPFLIWFGKTKTSTFNSKEKETVISKFDEIKIKFENYYGLDNWIPSIFNIERWWSSTSLNTLSALRTSIVEVCGEPLDSDKTGNLIWIAFCRLIIETSSAAFNHVSMSFKDSAPEVSQSAIINLFDTIISNILLSANSEISGNASVTFGDAKETPDLNGLKANIVITSPPYPNRISYIRELRPYMYWTKFIEESKQAGEIDWKAIGGTWGTATSNLKKWSVKSKNLPNDLLEVTHKIGQAENKHSDLMRLYVLKYFDDINIHIENIRPALAKGAKLYYIIGNSSFYVSVRATTSCRSYIEVLPLGKT